MPASGRFALWWWLLVCGWALFLLLGSWYPFQYRSGEWNHALSVWLWIGANFRPSATDLAINVIIGIPLGLFGGLAVFETWRHVWSRLLACVLVLVGASLWASFIELGQYWFAGRVPSLTDTLAQVTGAFIRPRLGRNGCWFFPQSADSDLGLA